MSRGRSAHVRAFSDTPWALAPCAVPAAQRRGLSHDLRALLTVQLPGSSVPAITLLALFAAVQLLDATLTWTGILKFGAGIEGNPLLALSFGYFGAGATLGAAKLVAMGCAVILHWRSHFLALSVLTLFYVFGAIVPWSWTLGL